MVIIPAKPQYKAKFIPDEAKHSMFLLDIPDLRSSMLFVDTTITEIIATESLLSPSTQMTIKIQAPIHSNPIKNYDELAGKAMKMVMARPILREFGMNDKFEAEMTIYRAANRRPINNNVELFTIHACDNTLLKNSAKRVSKSWECVTPSAVVSDLLHNCIGAPRIDIESCGPPRPYIAENIRPFQAIAQNADVALYGGNDPCFLHFMTFQDGGTHHFRSLKSLAAREATMGFVYSEHGENTAYANPYNIMNYQFPCDFDVLSDIENGVMIDGTEHVSVLAINPFNGVYNMYGVGIGTCGFGGSVYEQAFTNQGTAQPDGTCEIKTEAYMLRRQARLELLNQDKIALQITVPFNPNIYAGSTINCAFIDKVKEDADYGSGKFLVTTVSHRLMAGGPGFTTLDCVARNLGLRKT